VRGSAYHGLMPPQKWKTDRPAWLARLDRAQLARAARAALRAVGDVEPNPPVGCVIGRVRGEGDRAAVETLGVGHHRRFGGPHAEVEALRACAGAGVDARGATAWVTLEPCAHKGKTGPCADALIRADVARVVMARRDTHASAGGGADRLRAEGVRVDLEAGAALAHRLTAPFFMRLQRGRPWVIAKWAQTLDGRVATRAGASQWISSETSRRRVHRLRAQVDAIVTGVGTALADDPRLTPRGAPRVRRAAARVVLDSNLRTPPDAAMLRETSESCVIVIGAGDAADEGGWRERRRALEEAGAEVWTVARREGRLDLEAALRMLSERREATRVMLECGPRLLGSFLEADLVDEAQVYVAPLALGDESAAGAAAGRVAPSLADGRRFEMAAVRRSGPDALLHLWRADG